jgi:hypothetical protein
MDELSVIVRLVGETGRGLHGKRGIIRDGTSILLGRQDVADT